jgi:outer membrane lipoprotein SlyB
VISCNNGVVESRTIHRDMSESVFREVLLEASQQEVVGEVGGEVEGWNHLGSDEGMGMGKTHTVAGDIPAND